MNLLHQRAWIAEAKFSPEDRNMYMRVRAIFEDSAGSAVHSSTTSVAPRAYSASWRTVSRTAFLRSTCEVGDDPTTRKTKSPCHTPLRRWTRTLPVSSTCFKERHLFSSDMAGVRKSPRFSPLGSRPRISWD